MSVTRRTNLGVARSSRALIGIALGTLMAASLSGCGETVATCDEYARMGSDTGLFNSANDAQSQALKVSLREAGYDDGALNRTLGHTEVVAYCNIYDGVAGNNKSQPISNAH